MVEKRKNNKYNSYYNTTIGVKATHKDSRKPTLTKKLSKVVFVVRVVFVVFSFIQSRVRLPIRVIRTIRVLKKLKQQSRVRLHIRVIRTIRVL